MKIIAEKAIRIARVSTAHQKKDDKTSPETQLASTDAYAKRHGFDVIGTIDFDESASRGKRRKFGKALKIVEQSEEPIAILISKVDRLTRVSKSKELLKLDELRRAGKVELHFVDQGLIIHRNSRAAELITWNALIFVAESEIELLRERIMMAQKARLKNNIYPGKAPTGYIQPHYPQPDGTIIKKIELDPIRTPLIKEMFELYSSGEYSFKQIANIMKTKGLTIKGKMERDEKTDKLLGKAKDRPINEGDVWVILENPFYTGKFRWKNPETGETEIYKGKYPALISEELFEKVQKTIAYRRRRTKGLRDEERGGKNFLFKGILKCAHCGCDFTGEDKSRERTRKGKPTGERLIRKYYHCTNGKAKRSKAATVDCNMKGFTEEELIEAVFRNLDNGFGLIDRNVVKALKENLSNEYRARLDFVQLRKKEIHKEQTRIDKVLIGMPEAFQKVKNDEVLKILEDQVQKLRETQNKLAKELNDLEKESGDYIDESFETLELLSDFREMLQNASEGKKVQKMRRAMKFFFDHIAAFHNDEYQVDDESIDRYVMPIWREEFRALVEPKIREHVKKLRARISSKSQGRFI